eukprot:scaffold5067_cov65-Phaeocystis_antarctica.AAC.8
MSSVWLGRCRAWLGRCRMWPWAVLREARRCGDAEGAAGAYIQRRKGGRLSPLGWARACAHCWRGGEQARPVWDCQCVRLQYLGYGGVRV